ARGGGGRGVNGHGGPRATGAPEPVPGRRPRDGLCPKTPQQNAGIRIEPPMSEPSPIGEAPLPIAAPSPPEEPPAVRAVLYGFLVRPYSRFSDSTHRHISDVLLTP